jgi:hypothetical protein
VPLTLKSDLTDDEPTRSNTNTLPFVTRPGSCWKILDKQLHTKISLEQERKCLCPNIQSFCFCVKPATEQNAWSCTSPNVKALEEGGADGWTILALFRIKFFLFCFVRDLASLFDCAFFFDVRSMPCSLSSFSRIKQRTGRHLEGFWDDKDVRLLKL